MIITERLFGDVTVLDLRGRIELGQGDEQLTDKINSLVQQGRKRVLLNLLQTSYVDAAGMGAILSAYTTLSGEGGSLKLLHLTRRIQDLLAIQRILTIFECHDSEERAIQSFHAST
jgi:anti-sigma B factor antagonist